MIDANGGVLEAGDENAGQVFVVFDEQDVGWAIAMMQNTAKLGEEEVFVEGFLDPTLSVAGELGGGGWRRGR